MWCLLSSRATQTASAAHAYLSALASLAVRSAKVATNLEPQAIANLVSAAEAIEKGEVPPPAAIGTAFSVFTQMPPESKKMMLEQLPPEAAPIATAIVSSPSIDEAAVVKIAEATMSLADGGMDMQSADPKAIAALHSQLKTLPPPVTHALIEQLPSESQDMAAAALEMGQGMNEAEVAELVQTFQDSEKQTGTPDEQAKQARDRYFKMAKTVAFSEMRRVSVWVKEGPCGLQVLSFLGGVLLLFAGLLDIFVDLARFDVAVMVIQLFLILFAIVIISLEAKSLLCNKFLGAQIAQYAACLSRATGRACFYLLVGSLSLAQWRVSTSSPDESAGEDAESGGLGQYFSWASSKGWLNAIAGLWLVVVSLVLLVFGYSADSQMRKMASDLADEQTVRQYFSEFDENSDGQLDLAELAKMLGKLCGRVPGHQEVEIAMRELDKDLSGTVSVDELVQWWGERRLTAALVAEDMVMNSTSSDTSSATAKSRNRGAESTSDTAAAFQEGITSAEETLRNVKSWADGIGNTSVRGLSFFSGVGLCTVSAVCAVIGDVFVHFNLLKILVDSLLFLGGLVIVVMDGPLTPALPWLRQEFMVLTTVAGRGVFQVLIGLLAASQGWQNFSFDKPLADDVGPTLYLGMAGVLLFFGVVFIVAGMAAKSKLDDMKKKFQTPEALQAAFKDADKDQSGALSASELAGLAVTLGSELDKHQLHVAIDMLDTDRNGTISFEEFSAWWGSSGGLFI